VRPRVICLERGCGNITDQPPRCDEHSDHVLPRHPNRLPRPRYDAAWSRYSAQLRKEQPWCTRCGSTEDLTVDHILALVDIPSIVVRSPSGFDITTARPRRVLVPVSAGRSSRAAEEVAYSLAHSVDGSVTAIHIVDRPDGQGMMFNSPADSDAMRDGRDIVGAAVAFGKRFGTDVEGVVRTAPNAEEEIVALANHGGFDLLVIGTSNRPLTDRPFFGHRVQYVLEHTEIPVAVVALPEPSTGRMEGAHA